MFAAIMFFFMVVISGAVYAFLHYSKESVLKEAIELYSNGNIEEAAEKFRAYTLMKGGDVIPRIYLSKIYFDKKEYIECIRECVAISMNRGANPGEKSEAYAMLAEIYLEQNQINRSAQMIAEGMRQMPKNPRLHYTLGLIYLRTEKMNNAIISFNNVIANDRGNIPARVKLAEIHRNNGDMVKAIFQYKKIIELDPSNQDARYNLAMIYFNDWDYEKAYNEMKLVRQDENTVLDYNYITAKYFLEKKDNNSAKDFLERLVNDIGGSRPEIIEAKYELGKIYQSEERYQDAFDMFKAIPDGGRNSVDIEKRMYELEKILNPSYYEELMEKINYAEYSLQESEELFYEMIEKLGYKEVKVVERGKDGFSVVAVDRYRPAVNEKYFIAMLRREESVTEQEIIKFKNDKRDEKAQFGILMATSLFDEKAAESIKEEDRITLIDKINIYEFLGG